MRRLLRRLFSDQQGITGIETAIILIAFVIVASVFAYVVLSAGLFSTQKAKEAISAGINEAQSTVEVKGNLYGTMVNSVLTSVTFTLATTTGGEVVDFTPPSTGNTSKVIISYSDAYQMFPSLNWTLTKLNSSEADNILDSNKLFQITVDLTPVSIGVSDDQKPRAYHTFTIEVKPPVGAVLSMERTIPARVNSVINLY